MAATVLPRVDASAYDPMWRPDTFVHPPSAPFADDPTADVILRSSEKSEFRVVAAILAVASPVFSDMFNIPQPPNPAESDETSRGLPVVSLTEDSMTIDTVLRICYPIPVPPFESFNHVMSVLEAGRKYMIDVVQQAVTTYLVSALAPQTAVDVYLIACKYELEDVARAAAPKTLGLSLDEVFSSLAPEADTISFACMQRLYAFRKACTVELAALLRPETWLQSRKGLYRASAMPWVVQRRPRVPEYDIPGLPQFTFRPETTSRNSAISYHEGNATHGEHDAECLEVEVKFEAPARVPVPAFPFPNHLNVPLAPLTAAPSAMVRTWWMEYMRLMSLAYKDLHISGRVDQLEHRAFHAAVFGANACKACRATMSKEFMQFERTLRTEIDKRVAELAERYTFTKSELRIGDSRRLPRGPSGAGLSSFRLTSENNV